MEKKQRKKYPRNPMRSLSNMIRSKVGVDCAGMIYWQEVINQTNLILSFDNTLFESERINTLIKNGIEE